MNRSLTESSVASSIELSSTASSIELSSTGQQTLGILVGTDVGLADLVLTGITRGYVGLGDLHCDGVVGW